MPRLTVLISEDHTRWLTTRAQALGFSAQAYLRSILLRRLDEYGTGLVNLPPGNGSHPAALSITLAGPLARRIEVVGERLGYSAYSNIIRTCIQQECEPFAQMARGQGFAHALAFEEALAAGQVAPVMLTAEDYQAGDVLATLADRFAEMGDETNANVASLLERVAAAIKLAQQRHQAPRSLLGSFGEDQLQRWAVSGLPDSPVHYACGEPPSVTPFFDLPTYLGKMGHLFATLARTAVTQRGFTVTYPETLGDTWEEILQTLSLIAELRLTLMIRSPHLAYQGLTVEYRTEYADLGAAIQRAAATQVPLVVVVPSALGSHLQDLLLTLSALADNGVAVAFAAPVVGAYSLRDTLNHATCITPHRPSRPQVWP